MKKDTNANGSKIASFFRRYWPLLVVSILFILVQYPVFESWWKVWNERFSYFSHGPLVPFIVGYMVWANRKRIARISPKPCWYGYVMLLISALLYVLGSWTLGATIRAAAFILMIFGVLLSVFGTKITRILIIPVAFLITMIPLAPTLLDQATAKLQWQSAAFAAKILTLTGYSSSLSAATIYSDGLPEPLVVGVPCSGLRTFISLITFTVFFVYIVRSEWWKKLILLVVAFPLSLFTNALRIAMIGYAGIWTQSAVAMHKFHDYSGYLGLIICFAILFGIAKLLKIESFGISDEVNGNAGNAKWPHVVGAGLPGIIVCTILAVTALTNLNASPIYPQAKGRLVRSNIPMQFDSWTGQDLPIEKMVSDWLKQGDLLSRMYTDNNGYGKQIQVFITASRDPAGFHDPHVCLPGGGSPINGERKVQLHFDRPFKTTVTATLLHTTNDYGEGLVMYWYMYGHKSMPITNDVWKQNKVNQQEDIIRLIKTPWKKADIKKEVENRQFVWYRFSTQIDSNEKTDLNQMEKFATDFVAHVKDFGEMGQ